ncbi:MAG: HutD family protein [Bacilli bacterium]|jgi:environmental stress-induced protein Ves|nr:HutD family protein [Bacilli bacterium]
MLIKLIKYYNLKETSWSGGITKEIYLYPDSASYQNKNFLFRVSSAYISTIPSKFTLFIGYQRYFCMLDNNLELSINNKNISLKAHDIINFQSEDDVISYQTGNDFNIMLAEDIKDHHLKLTNGFNTSDHHFIIIFVLKDLQINIQGKDYQLAQYDTIVIENLEHESIDIVSKDHYLLGLINLVHDSLF